MRVVPKVVCAILDNPKCEVQNRMDLRRDGSDPNASAACPSWTARPLQWGLAEGHRVSEWEGPKAHLPLSVLGQSKAAQGQFLA